MYQYIKGAIDNNEYIYLCLEESSFDLLLNYFTEDEKKHIGILTVSTLINLYKSEGEIIVNTALNKYIESVVEHGYIGQNLFTIQAILLRKFLNLILLNLKNHRQI